MTFEPTHIAAAVAIACVALGAGVFLGRRTGKTGQRLRELTNQLEAAGKDRELAQASLEAAKSDIASLKAEQQQYRSEVVEHFTGASDLMRDLTVQYRAVYDHLTQGATGLCPPGSVGLQEGLQVEQLATGAREEAAEAGEAAGAA
jgi:uncharacterized membrane-anchored protein YhcB (DUF1043 family)